MSGHSIVRLDEREAHIWLALPDRITDTGYYQLEWGLASDLDSAWLPGTSGTGVQDEPTQFIEASLLRWPPE